MTQKWSKEASVDCEYIYVIQILNFLCGDFSSLSREIYGHANENYRLKSTF